MPKFRTDWVEIGSDGIRSIKWRKDEDGEPSDLREDGELLVHYDDNEAIYKPIKYGWFLLATNQSSPDVSASILSGVTTIHKNEENNQLLTQLHNVMNLDELEKSLLIRLHGVIYDSHESYGILREDFNPTICCTLLAFLIEHHRNRSKKDIWSRAAATHSNVGGNDIKDRYNDIEDYKMESMRKITQFTSMTGQEELPTVNFNNG